MEISYINSVGYTSTEVDNLTRPARFARSPIFGPAAADDMELFDDPRRTRQGACVRTRPRAVTSPFEELHVAAVCHSMRGCTRVAQC